MVRVKSNFDGDIRRFVLSDAPTFTALCEQIRSTYSVKHGITIKYKDEEGDLVTIASDADLDEAIAVLNGEGMLRIDVASSIASVPSIPTTEPLAGGSQSDAQGASEQPQDVPSGSSSGDGAAGSRAGNTSTQEPSPEEFISHMARIAEQVFGFQTAAAGEGRSTSADDRTRNDTQGENTGANEPTPEELMNNLARMAAHFMGGPAACGGMRRAGRRGMPRSEGANEQWRPEAGRSPVPHPPLTFGSTGDEVKYLQYKLTEMGYMTPADYRFRMGMFGPRTANAVARFRAECGLGYGMYDQEAAAAMQSLLETGVPVAMGSGGSEQQGQTSEAEAAQSANAEEQGDNGKVGA